jgi:adenylylsulfate reductase subunit A
MKTKISNSVKTMDTDVLILGSGAAGCGAAIAARAEGARVLLVDKAKLEGSGSICGGNDHFMANLNTGPAWDTDEAVGEAMKRAHEGVSAEVITKRWAKIMPIIIKILEDSGLEFVKNPDGTYHRTTGFAQPGPWWMNIKNGWLMKKLLAKKIRSLDIDVLDHVMGSRLFKSNGRIAGAAGFNVLDGAFYALRAKTVVLALGREANRATNNSSLNPFNSWCYPYNTGSNNVLAYQVGAKIHSLELNDMGTLMPKGFGCPGMNGINSMGGHELNAFGERFMGKYDPEFMENTIRRKQVAATYQELIQGKGPPFHMDMRHLSKEDNDLLQNVLMPGDKATFLDYLAQKKMTFATHPLEIEVSEIHLGGRLVINDMLESTVPGLFSGCNFHFLSGAMCGGYSAGLEAAKQAKKMANLDEIDKDELNAERKYVFQPLKNKVGLSPRGFENTIRQVMDYYMGYIRNEKGIETALEKLDLIASYADKIKASNLHELMRANEARHLLKHCQLSTLAGTRRKESGRTIYVRSDYPDISAEFSGCLEVWQENGKQKIAFGKPL